MILTVTVNTSPVSSNRIYPSNRSGRRFLSKEGAAYKREVQIATRDAYLSQGFSINPETQFISSEVFFYSTKLLTKQGKLNKKKPDTDNCLKALFDSIFETLGIDDYLNMDCSAQVMPASKDSIVVILRAHHLSAKFDIFKTGTDN